MRTRSKGALYNSLTYTTDLYPLSCANRIHTISTGGIGNVYIGDRTTTTDVVTPDYWKRKKRGDVILNPYHNVRIVNISNGSTVMSHTSVPKTCTGPDLYSVNVYSGKMFIAMYAAAVDVPSNTNVISGTDTNRLLDEIWTRCLADRQKGLANLSESLAEIDKTFDMVSAPLENVISFVRDFRRHGKRKNKYLRVAAQSKDFIDFASSEWLRFRYGITPLMGDVKAVMKALKKDYKKEPKTVTTRASGSINRNSVSTGSFTNYPYLISYQVARADQLSVRATHFDKYTPSLFNTLGLTFHNVVGVAWELTRYSFVVDWFANIGDLLYANIPRVGVSSYGGVLTAKRVVTSFYYPTSTVSSAPTVWTVAGSASDSYLMTTYDTNRFIRSDDQSALVINSDFRFDKFNRVMDAITLTNQWLRSVGFSPH